MRSFLKKSLLAAAFLAALALSAVPTAAFASTKPASVSCHASWVYSNVTNTGVDYYGLGPQFTQYNPYSYSITANWSVTVSASVSVSANAGVSADLSAIVAGVQVNVNSQVQFTVNVSGTIGVFVPISSHQRVYGQFSVERQKASGHLFYRNSDCSVSQDRGTVSSWTPWRATWHLW